MCDCMDERNVLLNKMAKMVQCCPDSLHIYVHVLVVTITIKLKSCFCYCVEVCSYSLVMIEWYNKLATCTSCRGNLTN